MESPKRKISPRQYRKMVWTITESQPLNTLDGFEKRGIEYHLDHIIPVNYGYQHCVNPEIIGHISNLRIIKATENIKKGRSINGINVKIPLFTESGENAFVDLSPKTKAAEGKPETDIQMLRYMRIGKQIKTQDLAKIIGVNR